MSGQLRKYISLFILSAFGVSLIFGEILLPIHEAKAVYPVTDVALIQVVSGGKVKDGVFQAADTSKSALQVGYQSVMASLGIAKDVADKLEKAMVWAFSAFKKKLLDMMADQIINWINGGGKPTFVTDWQAFLRKAANDVGGNFVSDYLDAGFLCKNISPQVQLMLARPQTFDTAAVCTLSQIGTNIQNFYNNFTTGGWKGWLTISETQNNLYGMYFYALDQKWSAEQLAAKTSSEAAQSAAGFLGDQVCLHYFKRSPTGNPDDNIEVTNAPKDAPKRGEPPFGLTDANCTKWYTRTPGKVAADSLSKIAGKDWDWLLQSTEYSQYIVAIADAVINRTIKEGLLLIMPSQTDTSGGSLTIDYSTVTAGVADYADAAQNGPYAVQLISQEKLLKENLAKIMTEYQTNLSILDQTRAAQGDAFNALKNIATENCPLPGGASQQNLGTQTTSNCGADVCPCESKTVETIKVTAPSFGEATFQSTTVEKFTLDREDQSCSGVTRIQTASTTLGSLSTDAELALINAAISTIQSQMGLIDTAVIDLQNYQKTIDDYNTAYDATQSHVGSQAGETRVATSTTAAMYSAKQKAINSTRAVIESQSSTLNNLLSDIMSANQNTANQNSTATQKRGFDMSIIGDCANSTGYYKTLCDIQAIKTSWEAEYNSCLDSR